MVRVGQYRDGLGMTQQEFADAVGISRSYLAEIENGVKPGSRKAIERIARYLRVQTDALFEPDDQRAEQDIELMAIVRRLAARGDQEAIARILDVARLSERAAPPDPSQS